MRFDIFLVAAPKDYNKLPYALTAITQNVSGYDNIYLCTPHVYKDFGSLHFPIHYRTDMAVLKATPHRWRYRPNWIYQQFLKLFQQETGNDWYLVVDADTIINKPLSFFESGKPVWRYFHNDQYNEPYYRFNETMFDFSRECGHTWLADMGFYSKSLVKKMLAYYNYTIESFIEKSYQIIKEECYPSEADVYMGYIYKHHPDLYVYKMVYNKGDALIGNNPMELLWSDQAIQEHINKMKATDYETFAIHSWINRSHNSWRGK